MADVSPFGVRLMVFQREGVPALFAGHINVCRGRTCDRDIQRIIYALIDPHSVDFARCCSDDGLPRDPAALCLLFDRKRISTSFLRVAGNWVASRWRGMEIGPENRCPLPGSRQVFPRVPVSERLLSFVVSEGLREKPREDPGEVVPGGV